MENKYSTVCRKMIEHYSKFLYEKEILALQKILKINNYDNLNIIIFINKLIDRIWQMTLTNPKQYIEGKPFTFLTTRDLIPIEYNLNEMSELKKHQNHFLELITDDSIINSFNGINGMIVEIDYINSFSEPILPIDFQDKKRILAKTKLNINGVYNISLKLEKYDAEVTLTDEFAELASLPKIDINKCLYNLKKNNIILSPNDKESLANTIIVYYLIENNYDKNENIIRLRDNLKKKYKSDISKQYIKYFKDAITLEDLINYVFDLLNNDIDLQMFDKTM